jgi:hypothetical protein
VRLAIAVAAPIVFFAVAELALAIVGVRVPRYVSVTAEADYWIPYVAPGKDPGFQRSIPRPWKDYPEELPLFVKNKPANGFRVFSLGESSVQGAPYEIGSFSDWLRIRLRAMMPDRLVEVVNAGNGGWYSREIYQLARECLDHGPDLLVVMMGHNEMAPQNFNDVARRASHPMLADVGDWVAGFRMAYLLGRLLPQRGEAARITANDRKITEEKPGCTDAEFAVLQSRYRDALEGIVVAAKKARVPVLLRTMPRNLRACPSSSYFSETVRSQPALRAAWEQHFRAGCDALEKGSLQAALASFSAAQEIDASPNSISMLSDMSRPNRFSRRASSINASTATSAPPGGSEA